MNVVPAVLIGFGLGAILNGCIEHSFAAIVAGGVLIGSGIFAWSTDEHPEVW